MTSRHGHRGLSKEHAPLPRRLTICCRSGHFLVRCVVNATQLRPNAARESFYEDSRLTATREELGSCLKAHLIQLSQGEQGPTELIIGCHYLPIKALAVEDDEFFKLFIDWLPFETTLGQMTLGEYRQREKNTIRYVPSRDQFRQIAGVAAAQKICIINAGYTYVRRPPSKNSPTPSPAAA